MFSRSVNDTHKIAAELARNLPSGTQAVALDGDLGAGKTAFAQGFIGALGYNGAVTSPTYAIVNEYELDVDICAKAPLRGGGGAQRRGLRARNDVGIVPYRMVSHFDWYRLGSLEELTDIGWYEYLERGLCIVEWSDRIPGALPEHTVKVSIRAVGESKREILIS